MNVGFIGLGRMGQGMARNLLKSTESLTVFDTNPSAVQMLVDEGAVAALSLEELVRSVDVIFTSLPGPPQVEEVMLGAGGILEFSVPGLAVFDLSTSSLSLARRIQSAFAERGMAFLDAPVSGGPAGAASGDLVIWVGGNKNSYEKHLPHLSAIGRAPRHVGDIGSGTVIKLAHNLLGYTIMLAEAEIFSMASKAGVDALDLWEALRLGVVGKQSPLDMLTKQFLPGSYDTPAFALKLARKDVVLATELARELEVPMRLGNLTLQEMTEAISRGMGDKDSRAYLQLQLERSDVKIAVEPDRLERALDAQSR